MPVVVVSAVWLTSTPVMPGMPPVPMSAAAAPVEMVRPCSLALVASVMVPPSVVVPVFRLGRVIVPVGGVIPKRASKPTPGLAAQKSA